MFRKTRQLHFVGIGGSGMSGIAEVLVNLGYRVSGSDLASSDTTRHLKRIGARVYRGHRDRNVAGADVVIVSSAVRNDNPELLEARRSGIPVIPRAEMLAELMRLKHGVAVAGSHGKTSTTGMIAEVLSQAGFDPTVVVGGRFSARGSGAKLGRGEVMVAEADESDGSFLKMKPTIAVVTNIDREHLEHYRDLAEIREAFAGFLARVPFYGTAVVCTDDSNVRQVVEHVDRRVVRYGLSDDAEVAAEQIEASGFGVQYELRLGDVRPGRVSLRVPGRHSVLNSLAAIAVAREFDVPFTELAPALAGFRGIDRRFQLRGRIGRVPVIDDYGHHPTEIRATLSAVHDGFEARTIVIFQPHRYTRTRALLDDFARSFDLAHEVIVTDVYPAGEDPLPGVDGEVVARALRRHGHRSVRYEPQFDEIARRVLAGLQPGDLVLTLGAGDVWKAGEALLRRRGGTRGRSASASRGRDAAAKGAEREDGAG